MHPTAAFLLASTSAVLAQGPTVPPGYRATELLTETAHAASVRAAAFTGDGFLVALGRDLELRRPGSAPRRLLRLRAGEEFGFVAVAPGNRALVGELLGGRIQALDLSTGRLLGSFAGPKNAFDAVALASGDVLLNANPAWPAANAHAGVWLAGPSRSPRELLALTGPSGPLDIGPGGELVVAELGAIVPPPPGAARLLRFDAPVWQQAIAAGGTLSVQHATATANGYAGIYDLAFDDLGRVHVSDPQSGAVVQSAPGSLAPTGTTIDLGPGRYGLWLAFDDDPNAPFVGYQPADRAPALLVSHSDFATRFAISRLAPQRPGLACQAAGALPPLGTATLAITAGPPGGLAAVIATTSAPVPEFAFAVVSGVPIWLAVAPATTVPFALASLDPLGAATIPFTNPGGHALSLTFQAAVLGQPAAIPAVGTSAALVLLLSP